MATLGTRNEFAPPPMPGLLRALGLALAAHGLLLLMLTVGVQWKRDATPVTVEAELWSAVPVEAAPRAPEPLPEPQPVPVPAPVPAPPPPQPQAPPEPTPIQNADIAQAKEKARLQKEKQLQQEKREQEQREQEKQAKLRQDQLNKDKLAREKQAQANAEQAKKLQQEQRAQEAKAAEAAKQKSALKAREEAQKLEELRQQNIKRMAGLAGAASGSGDERARGSAAQSAGPSAGYGGRIVARIRPNITYTETIPADTTAEVEVRTAPDGTILSRKLSKSSGVKSWDEAVLKAIDKTVTLPRDVDGRVPPSLLLSFRPRD